MYHFVLANESMLEQIYSLFEKRIEWMDKVGIKQWNVTDYLKIYSRKYYINQIREHHLYVMIDNNDKVVGAIVLLEQDSRWEQNEPYPAYYLHNFVTDIDIKGIGEKMLTAIDELAKANHKSRIRLDCAEDNIFLNNYYESHGYLYVDKCIAGLYKGNKREKSL